MKKRRSPKQQERRARYVKEMKETSNLYKALKSPRKERHDAMREAKKIEVDSDRRIVQSHRKLRQSLNFPKPEKHKPLAMETVAKRAEKKTTPAQRALAKQRIEQRKAGYRAKRAADTRSYEEVSRDLDRSTSRLKNKRARRVLKRNSEGKGVKQGVQKVGKAANTPSLKGGPGGKAGGFVTKGMARAAGPIGVAITLGEMGQAANRYVQKDKGKSSASRKTRGQRFITAQQQDKDRAKAKHPPKGT